MDRVLLGIWCLAVGFVFGDLSEIDMNHTCAKQHNVYSCHLISVPDEKGE